MKAFKINIVLLIGCFLVNIHLDWDWLSWAVAGLCISGFILFVALWEKPKEKTNE